jgi:hypothetical protein
MYGDVAFVKQQCQEIAIQFITKLKGRFLAQDLMDALGVIRPQYWLQPKPKKGSMLYECMLQCRQKIVIV